MKLLGTVLALMVGTLYICTTASLISKNFPRLFSPKPCTFCAFHLSTPFFSILNAPKKHSMLQNAYHPNIYHRMISLAVYVYNGGTTTTTTNTWFCFIDLVVYCVWNVNACKLKFKFSLSLVFWSTLRITIFCVCCCLNWKSTFELNINVTVSRI